MNGNSLALQGGTLSGSGSILGNVANTGGTVGPGNSPGVLHLAGNYTQTANGILDIQLGGYTQGTQYDLFAVTGGANLDGTLNIDLVNGFSPVIGDQFDFLTRGFGTGTFGFLTSSSPGLTYDVTYGAQDVFLTIRSAAQTDVPEPGSVGLLGAGAAGVFICLRRRRK
jgi:hypothetical protein